MSIEFGSPTIEHSPRPVSTDLGTAVGEFMFSPDTWKQGLELAASAGRVFTSALNGTLQIASITTGVVSKGVENYTPVAPVSSIPTGQGGPI